ncbi:glycosyltransferase [Escherichia coli]|uniref:glycosyltransferase n=1 Tax=Escherichia coli TaxID=562 RepID=UPI00207D0E5B|nr:glycosyltransferase [Escherichia coli]
MSENSMFFSLLMAVCKKDDPTFLFEALKSIANNSLQPTEVILVEDGPITRELRKVINGWSNVLNIKSIGLERNSGLGAALNEGLNIVNMK